MTTPTEMFIDQLKTNVTLYVDGVNKVGGDSISRAKRNSLKQAEGEANPEKVKDANTVVDAIISNVRDWIELDASIMPALYVAFRAKLLTYVKDERDMYLNGFTGNMYPTRESADTPTVEALTSARTIADGLFNVVTAMGFNDFESVGIETEKSEKTGKVSLKLPRLPKGFGSNSAARVSISRKMLWTVDGVQHMGYTMAGVRKIISPDEPIRVQDIRDALRWEDTNVLDGKIYPFTLNGKDCTFQVIGAVSSEEFVAASDDDDNGDGE